RLHFASVKSPSWLLIVRLVTLLLNLKIADTGGHETHRPGECQNDRRRFQAASQGCRQAVARCGADQFGYRACTGEDRSPGDSRQEQRQALKGTPVSGGHREKAESCPCTRRVPRTGVLPVFNVSAVSFNQ